MKTPLTFSDGKVTISKEVHHAWAWPLCKDIYKELRALEESEGFDFWDYAKHREGKMTTSELIAWYAGEYDSWIVACAEETAGRGAHPWRMKQALRTLYREAVLLLGILVLGTVETELKKASAKKRAAKKTSRSVRTSKAKRTSAK